MAFDPDAFLAGSSQPSGGFDPDAFLASAPPQPSGISKAYSFAKKYAPEAAKGMMMLANPIEGAETINAGEVFPAAQKAADVVAPNAAEKVGQLTGSPVAGTLAGLATVAAPTLAGAAGGGYDLETETNPVVRGLVNTPQELGPEYQELHEAAGISKNLPMTGGRNARFPNMAGQPSANPPPFAPTIAPNLYPRDPNALMNFARSRMEGLGDQLSPQELNDYKTLIGQMIDTGKVGSGTPLANAAQLRNQASTLLENRVNGLVELNQAYAVAKKVQNPFTILPQSIQNLVTKYGPWIARVAAGTETYRLLRGH